MTLAVAFEHAGAESNQCGALFLLAMKSKQKAHSDQREGVNFRLYRQVDNFGNFREFFIPSH